MLADNRAPAGPRVYDAAQVDEYVQRLHTQTATYKDRIAELESQLRAPIDRPLETDSELVAEARAEAMELLERARQGAEALIVEGERLAAAAVIRVLEHIDAIVDEWSTQGRRRHDDVVADLRERYTNNAG